LRLGWKDISKIIILIIICTIQLYSPKLVSIQGKTKDHLFESHNTDYRFEKKGSYDTGYGILADLFLSNNYLYTAVKQAGMLIFNVTNPEKPILLSSFTTNKELTSDSLWQYYGGLPSGIFVRDTIAYLDDGSNGLAVIDVHNPLDPFLLGQLKTVSVSNPMVYGNFVFCESSSDEISIINVENPRKPFLAHTITVDDPVTEFFSDFAISNNRLYATTNKELLVLNIDDPTEPFEIARISGSSCQRVVIDEEILYIYKYQYNGNPSEHSILLYNISNPNSLTFLTQYFLLYGIDGVQNFSVEHAILYLASKNSITAFDFSNKTNPSFLGEIKNIGYETSYKKIFVPDEMNDTFKGLVFCADQNKGLLIFNFTNPSNPSFVSQFDMGSKTTSVTVDKDQIYIIKSHESPSHPSILETVAISDSYVVSSIHEVIDNNSTLEDVLVEDTICYLSKYNYGVDILNVSDQENPQLISSFKHDGDFNHTYWSETLFYDAEKHLLFVSNSREGFAILDVSNQTAPKLLYAANPWEGDSVTDLFVCNDLLFLALAGFLFTGGFAILNISNPLSPKIITQWSVNDGVRALFCLDNLLYLATTFSLLKIYDISQPENPVKISDLESSLLFTTHELIVNNSIAYLARDANGLIAIDVSNSRKPKVLTIYRDFYAGISYDLAIKDNYIILADGWDGIEILELIPPKIAHDLYLALTIIPPTSGLILLIVITWNIIRKKQK